MPVDFLQSHSSPFHSAPLAAAAHHKPIFAGGGHLRSFHHFHGSRRLPHLATQASLIENPLLWAGRLCVFYGLLKSGLAGSRIKPLVSGINAGDGDLGFSKWLGGIRKGADGKTETADLGFTKWLEIFQKNPDNEAAERRKLVSKWHPTTKGTLKRNYRVHSKSEGHRLLKAIASLLSENDQFVDAATHKGCQIRRQNAHGDSVCCNNVRALFDELPTPHLVIEITAFPAGPLTERDYTKAEKLERVLRSSPSI
ncbi:hypothetical protein AKJ16_DCAP10262 [Drosera capensis]